MTLNINCWKIEAEKLPDNVKVRKLYCDEEGDSSSFADEEETQQEK